MWEVGGYGKLPEGRNLESLISKGYFAIANYAHAFVRGDGTSANREDVLQNDPDSDLQKDPLGFGDQGPPRKQIWRLLRSHRLVRTSLITTTNFLHCWSELRKIWPSRHR